jgi:DNA-binding MarR family transcriptional regulator
MDEKTQLTARQILQIVPLVMRTVAAELRQTGHILTPGHYHLLWVLSRQSYNISELAAKQSVSLASTSSSIGVLVERGWVKRERDANDRRKVVVELTPTGREVVAAIEDKAQAHVAELVSSLSSSDCERLSEGLAILRRVFASDRLGE